ncbi:hypothetical protein [Aureimonas mangrovi]|uniref:hypothetical protein n=1 Tax=Aureimonas mangrovi TaxID=2758041 RepID=UPI00163DB9B2|nr:hypothetical protein [Aureimonas mangrovi]
MAKDPLMRARARPDPAEWHDDELMTLFEAVGVFWPEGPLTVASLRTEIRNGSLTAERIAGKDLVTPRSLKEMRQRCRGQRSPRASTSARDGAAKDHGSSSTAVMKSAQAAALETVKALRESSRATSRENTRRRSADRTPPRCASRTSSPTI